MAYNRPPFQSIVGDDEYQQHMTQGYPNSTPSQWGSSSQHLPSWHSEPRNAGSYPRVGAGYPPTAYTQTQPGPPVHSMNPQQAPIFNSGYVDPGNTFIHSSSINHHASQNQQFRSPPPTPAYHSSAYSATWNSAPPTQQWATSSHASMPPPGGHSYHDPRHHNPYPNNPQPYHPSPPHAQILLTEASGDQDANISRKVCSHCRATSTPTWRRDPRTHKTLCNACGVYLAQRQHLRPQKLIDVDNEDPRGGDSEGEYDGPECSNCGTRKTSTWRRNRAGAQVCNACGVYERTNGRPRPLALRNDKVRPREKHRGTD